MTILECHECGKRCSPEFQLQGFVLRGLVECPECFEKRSNETDRLRKENKELKEALRTYSVPHREVAEEEME